MKTGKLVLGCVTFFITCSALALDIVTLASGEMKTGDVRCYANGEFVLEAPAGEMRFGTNNLQRITFSSEREGCVTSTNGATRTLRIISYEGGLFVFLKDAVSKSSFPCQRVAKIDFRSASTEVSRSPVSASTSHSFSGSGNKSWGGHSAHQTGSSNSGLVWVSGYYRADGTWVEGHWRDTTGLGSYTSSSGSSNGRVWVPGYRRADGTWVEGHWRQAGSSGATTSSYSRSSYWGGSRVYVGGYYRKDGTYVRGHTRRK